MAHSRDDPKAVWCRPRRRGLLPLDDRFHLPRRLARTIRQKTYQVRTDNAFAHVIGACAHPTLARPQTWINQEIFELFVALHEAGHAHSIEIWQPSGQEDQQEPKLIGGLYGLHLGGAFFAESMFSRVPNAGSIGLVALVALARRLGLRLIDTQFLNDHLARFGGYELADVTFTRQLRAAVNLPIAFTGDYIENALADFITHTKN